jgi:hypothetical protein
MAFSWLKSPFEILFFILQKIDSIQAWVDPIKYI